MLRPLASLGLATLAACGSPLALRQTIIDGGAVRAMECVAVLPFENLTSEGQAGRVVAGAMAGALATSQRFNVLAPEESEQVLRLLGATAPAPTTATAQSWGEALGVQAVLVGSVTEFEPPGAARAPNQPVVGFVAHLVDSASGQVVWTTAVSNFEHQVLLAVPKPRDELLREATDAAADELVDLREESLASTGLCAKAYGRINGTTTTAAAPAAPAVVESVSAAPAPAATPATEPAPPPAEPPPAATTSTAAPAAEPAASSAPAEPEARLELASAPRANPAGKPPKAVAAKLKGPAKAMGTQLYGKGVVEVRGAFPNYTKKALALAPKAKKLLDAVAGVLAAAPAMAVRIEVDAGVAKASASTAAPDDLARAQAELMRAYLEKRGLGAERVAVRPASVRVKKADKKANRVGVVVVRY